MMISLKHISHKLLTGYAVVATLVPASCIDTNVLPGDKTIEEDFWKTKADVQLMVSGAYKQMISSDVMTRMMLWGELRSDELLVNETPANSTVTALLEVQAADIQNTNMFCDWTAFYSAINYCNIVLSRAAQVMEIDPSYTKDDYLIDRSQMLALRAFAYFYLVRAYRDVPFSTEAFMSSSQELEIPQQAPLVVLDRCISDLIEASTNALQPDGFTDWRRVGYFNIEGINALLADMYLWRGSMTHSTADYEAAEKCCQRIIESKQALYPKDPLDPEAGEYPLYMGAEAYNNVFFTGNSRETVLELQYDGKNNQNTAVLNYYYLYAKNAGHGYCYASPIFSKVGSGQVYTTDTDYRYWESTYDVGNTQFTNFDVRKMIGNGTVDMLNSPTAFKRADEIREYSDYSQNWIAYRLTDVMLMKAEAMIARAKSDTDSLLQQAFALIKAVNDRSLYQASLALKSGNYNSRESMELLLLDERQRELCFEGKRWFDLMRYNYRHITPADPAKTLARLADEGVVFSRNSDTMLQLMARKYEAAGNGAGVIAKMRTEPTLYWPVSQSELKVNKNLRQNPVYSTADQYQKNF